MYLNAYGINPSRVYTVQGCDASSIVSYFIHATNAHYHFAMAKSMIEN